MRLSDVVSVFTENKNSTVKVDFGGALHNVNNIFLANDTLYFRSFELMSREEKVICDVSYADEDSVMTCDDFLSIIESYDSDNCYYSESFGELRDFSLDVTDNYVVLKLGRSLDESL